MKLTGVLITGGGGFLGSHLAELYLSKSIPVVCVDNFSTGLRSNRTHLEKISNSKSHLTFLEKDVSLPWKEWTSQISNLKISHIFHFASPASPPHYQRLSFETMAVNTTGLSEAIQYANTINARVIYASTSEIYGDPELSPQPESYWGNVNTQGPRSCYDEAKRFGETILFVNNQRFKTQHGLVRIFNTYGPRMNPNDGRVIINFLVQAIKGNKLSVYGTGNQTRSFCYVSDLISGIDRYAQTNLTEPLNIGNGNEFTILELTQTIQKIFNKQQIQIEFFPLPKDDPRQRCPDLKKAMSLLAPWHPEVSLEEGLRKMIDWLSSEDLMSVEMAGRPD